MKLFLKIFNIVTWILVLDALGSTVIFANTKSDTSAIMEVYDFVRNERGSHNMKAIIQKIKLKRWLPLVLAIALLTTVGVGAIAFFENESAPAVNTFTAAQVSVKLNEDFEEGGSEKKNVNVTNNGTAYVKVRAAVTVNWRNNAGGLCGAVPVIGTDYAISFGSGWTLNDDGFWYYNVSLAPGETSSDLIESCKPLAEKDGYKLMVDVAIDAVQADKVAEAWS